MPVYEPNQVRHLLPHLDFEPEWFLLGGPADASEAQDMRAIYPSIAIAGFEPNPLFYNLQLARGFPGRLLQYALWEERKALEMLWVSHVQGFWQEQRSASATKFVDHPDRRLACTVEARTLDDLSEEFGPFHDAILWIDIEEAELECLRGAVNLLRIGAIRLINAEILEEKMPPIKELLSEHGLVAVGRWNVNTTVIDVDDTHRVRRSWSNVIFKKD